jgi:hypothetical protein
MPYSRPRWFRWWLFPLTSVVHFGDELFVGGGFYTYVTAIGGIRVSPARFASATLFAFLSITIAAWVARKRYDWVLFVLAALVLTNALTHLGESLATHSYSPGLASGLVLWLPFGGAILYSGFTRSRTPAWWLGLVLGTVMNIAILLFTMHLGRIP